ncbi:hypothetical protein Hanom_Chr06g00527581 [Helianthus anomalus]
MKNDPCMKLIDKTLKFERIPKISHRKFFWQLSWNQLIDKNGKLLMHPFKLIKIKATCHSQIISHTSHKS